MKLKPLADRVLISPAAAEEKTDFDVELTEAGSEKIKVIKVIISLLVF